MAELDPFLNNIADTETNIIPKKGFGGSNFGDYIRVENGNIIIKDKLGVDRLLLGDLINGDAGIAIAALGVQLGALQTQLLASQVPVGTGSIYYGASAPAGYLLCNGSAVSRTTYSNLFAVVGTTYGIGDGSTTFNLPDLRRRVPTGYSSSDADFGTLGQTGGSVATTLPTHTHTQNSHNHTQNSHGHGGNDPQHRHSSMGWTVTIGSTSGTPATGGPIGFTSSNTGYSTTDITINDSTATNQATTASNQNSGSDASHANIQPYITINYIIKY